MSRPDIIRVILADDHLVVRAGLKALLSTSKDIEVVGEASNGRDAVALVDRLSPHVAVLDLDMPQMDGLTATKEIVGRNVATRVLILTMHTEDEFLVNLLEAGAAGYLVKNAADRELADARAQYQQLTERERDVLVHVAGGYSASEIGERLFISPKTF